MRPDRLPRLRRKRPLEMTDERRARIEKPRPGPITVNLAEAHGLTGIASRGQRSGQLPGGMLAYPSRFVRQALERQERLRKQ